MRLFRIVFCSLLTLGSTQDGTNPDLLKALGALSKDQIAAILAAAGSSPDVHVGGTNQDASLSAPVEDADTLIPKPEVIEQANPIPETVEAAVVPVVAAEKPVPATLAPVEPVAAESPAVEPAVELTNTEPQDSSTPQIIPELPVNAESDLTPTEEELKIDNPLTPIDNDEPQILVDTRISDTVEEEVIIPDNTEDETISSSPETVMTETAEAEPNQEEVIAVAPTPKVNETEEAASSVEETKVDSPTSDAESLLKAMSPEEIQALQAQLSKATAAPVLSQEVLAGQINAGQEALETVLDEPIETEVSQDVSTESQDVTEGQEVTEDQEDSQGPEVTNTDESVSTDYGSRATPEQLATDQTAPETQSAGISIVNPNPGIITGTNPLGIVTKENTESTEEITQTATLDETLVQSLPEMDTADSGTDMSQETESESDSVTEEITTSDLMVTSTEDIDDYVSEFEEEAALDSYGNSDLYDGYYEDEDYEEEFSGYGLLETEDLFGDIDDNLEDSLLSDVADNYNYRLSEQRERISEEITDIENEFEDQMSEEKASWNFAFFLIVFVIVVSAVYYAVNFIKTKFFPKTAQTYSLLPNHDADIKQAVSSEKEEWNNDDW